MRVLIVKLSSLGDVVHAMPVVHDIRAACAGAAVDWVVEPAFAPLVRRVDGIADVIECALRRWSRGWWTRGVRDEWRAFSARLRQERYDAVLDLQGLTKSAVVARLARGMRYGLANRTEGASHEPAARWLVDRAIRIAPRTPAVERSRQLAARALGYAVQGAPRFGLRACPVERPGQAPTLVFVHGSSRDDKLWPEAHWVALGRQVAADGWRIALPQAGAAELARAERLQLAIGPAAEVWPAMPLDALVDRLAATQGVIGVDSGLAHIAVALDLPHVQLYNFPTAWRTGPLGSERQVAVQGGWATPPRDAGGLRRWPATGPTGRRPDRPSRRNCPRSPRSGPPGAAFARRPRHDVHRPPRARGLLAVAAPRHPLWLLRFWWRGRAEPLYREHLAERFGIYRGRKTAGWVWVHAVSLGETRAATALVEALRLERPGMRLLLTHGTATGRDAGADLLRGGDMQVWLPVDTPGAMRRFMAHFAPSIGVLMETEIWPNLLRTAQARKLPMVVANARLSERSQRRGLRFDAVLRPLAGTLAAVLAQTDADAIRLRAAGAANVEVQGNLKFDLAPDADLIARGQAWRARAVRPVLLAAVTRDGEETMVLAAWTRLAEPRPLLVIVPRHPQRFDHVAGYIDVAGLSYARRSAWRNEPLAPAFAVDAWVGDSMREMPLYYGFADVALLGGSFAPFGGQNLIEAAACGCPVVMGPHTFNFAEAAEGSLEAGAALRVPDMAAGVGAALALLADPERLAATREAALEFAQRHRGAAERMAQRIVESLPRL